MQGARRRHGDGGLRGHAPGRRRRVPGEDPGGGGQHVPAEPGGCGQGGRLCFSNSKSEFRADFFLTVNFYFLDRSSNVILTFRKSFSEHFKIFVAKSQEI